LKQRLGHASLITTELYLDGGFLDEAEILRAKYSAARLRIAGAAQ
jgi:hypothetical protein